MRRRQADAALLALLLHAIPALALAVAREPVWLTKPSCSSEAALAVAAPLQLLPPLLKAIHPPSALR